MTSVHGGVPEKSVQIKQDVRNVSIFSYNKIIFIAGWQVITHFQSHVRYASNVSGLSLTSRWGVFIGCCKEEQRKSCTLWLSSILCIVVKLTVVILCG